MKQCIHCGNPLDEQANFCPYCMKTQQAAAPAPQIQPKKSLKWVWFTVPTALLLIGGILAAFFLLPPKEQEATPEPPEQTETAPDNTPKPPAEEQTEVPTLQTNQSAYDIHAQFGTLLGKNYEEVRSFFGTETAPSTVDSFTELVTHYFHGIEITVLPADGTIYAYTIDYTQADPPHRYNYRGIDSTASYGDVIELLGFPSDDSNYPYDVTYAMEQGYLRVFLGQELKVEKLFFLFPYE